MDDPYMFDTLVCHLDECDADVPDFLVDLICKFAINDDIGYKSFDDMKVRDADRYQLNSYQQDAEIGWNAHYFTYSGRRFTYVRCFDRNIFAIIQDDHMLSGIVGPKDAIADIHMIPKTFVKIVYSDDLVLADRKPSDVDMIYWDQRSDSMYYYRRGEDVLRIDDKYLLYSP